MNQQNTEQLIELVNSLKDRFNQKEMRRLDLDRLVRILIRLDSFSPECEDCKKLLVEMDNCLNQLAGLFQVPWISRNTTGTRNSLTRPFIMLLIIFKKSTSWLLQDIIPAHT